MAFLEYAVNLAYRENRNGDKTRERNTTQNRKINRSAPFALLICMVVGHMQDTYCIIVLQKMRLFYSICVASLFKYLITFNKIRNILIIVKKKRSSSKLALNLKLNNNTNNLP